jgi:hypothetical protein
LLLVKDANTGAVAKPTSITCSVDEGDTAERDIALLQTGLGETLDIFIMTKDENRLTFDQGTYDFAIDPWNWPKSVWPIA